MSTPRGIWEQPDWPHFRWQSERLTPLLRECAQAQGRLLGMAGATASSLGAENELDVLLQNIVTSSVIEGEQLNVGSVRSSLARRLRLEADRDGRVSPRSEGLAELMLDATQHAGQPLDEARCCAGTGCCSASRAPRRVSVAGCCAGTNRCGWYRRASTAPPCTSRRRRATAWNGS